MAKIDREALDHVEAPDSSVWRAWLEEHHLTQPAVWLILYTKASGVESIDWDKAVDEALCFGWIDSVVQRLDDTRRRQYFGPRKPKGNWSKVNKSKVERLIAEGKMMPAGLAAIERAKANGSWEQLDSVEAMIEPDELRDALDSIPVARAYFDGLSKSGRWQLLYWINSAKRAETISDRIRQVVEAAAEQRRPARFLP